jgi:hypothetical protein
MLDLNLRFHASCPKHPLYRPEEGPGAIKGGCQFCEALLRIANRGRVTQEAIREYEAFREALKGGPATG